LPSWEWASMASAIARQFGSVLLCTRDLHWTLRGTEVGLPALLATDGHPVFRNALTAHDGEAHLHDHNSGVIGRAELECTGVATRLDTAVIPGALRCVANSLRLPAPRPSRGAVFRTTRAVGRLWGCIVARFQRAYWGGGIPTYRRSSSRGFQPSGRARSRKCNYTGDRTRGSRAIGGSLYPQGDYNQRLSVLVAATLDRCPRCHCIPVGSAVLWGGVRPREPIHRRVAPHRPVTAWLT